MNREDTLLLIAALTLAELTLIAVIAYRVYQQVQPQINALQSTGSGVSGIYHLLTGQASTAATPG